MEGVATPGLHIIVITLSRVRDRDNYAMLHISLILVRVAVVVVVTGLKGTEMGVEGGGALHHSRPANHNSLGTQLSRFHYNGYSASTVFPFPPMAGGPSITRQSQRSA